VVLRPEAGPGQVAEARDAAQRSLAISEARLGRDHPHVRDAREMVRDLKKRPGGRSRR